MRLLHVGSGFRPWRLGGLVAYVEDLMEAQVQCGHEVGYLFSGRQYPLARAPRVHRWTRNGVAMLEVINSPLYDHGRQPDLELAQPEVERLFAAALAEFSPDLCHVQELAGLPSSVLDLARQAGVPTVLTLQDYFPLCSTFKLLDAEGHVCLRREVGADCLASVRADERPAGLLIEATVAYQLEQIRIKRGLESPRLRRWLGRVARASGEVEGRRRGLRQAEPSPPSYQHRREVNLERLNRTDCVLAMSSRVLEIYRQLGVEPARLRPLHLTLRHIEMLRPRPWPGEAPLTFATLGGFESAAKGGELLIETLGKLSGLARAGRFRLLVFGHTAPRLAARAADLPGLELRGSYRPEDLDRLLDEVHVGLMPSIWEEAYGYAGIEFLAKGIPVVANRIGGMTDYVRDGETGWLNHTRSAHELAAILSRLVQSPAEAAELSASVQARRDSIIKPHRRHVAEMDAVYRELVG